MQRFIPLSCKAGAILIASVLVLFLLFTFQPAVAYSPVEAKAWKVADPIVIDGNLGEWDKSTPIVIEDAGQLIRDATHWGGPTDLSLRVYLMWDGGNLYVAAEVKDDNPLGVTSEVRLDMLDSMVLYISTNPGADPSRTSYESTDFRVILAIDNIYFDTAFDRDMVSDPKGIYTDGMYGGKDVLAGYGRAVGSFPGGYTFEAKIPWSNFSNALIPLFVPSDNVVIGFNVVMNDTPYPCPGTEFVPSMAWVGDNTIVTNPSMWGTLRFESKVVERPRWFVDADNVVGLTDLMIVAYHYGETPSSPGWLPAADVDGDGSVGLTDLMIVAYHYGETWE